MDMQSTTGPKDGETTACQPVCVEKYRPTAMEHPNNSGIARKHESSQTLMQNKQRVPTTLQINQSIHQQQQLMCNLHLLLFQLETLIHLHCQVLRRSTLAEGARRLSVIMVSTPSSATEVHITTSGDPNSIVILLSRKHRGNGTIGTN